LIGELPSWYFPSLFSFMPTHLRVVLFDHAISAVCWMLCIGCSPICDDR
jgi:hypothetical protein